jgi:hypothetical protein
MPDDDVLDDQTEEGGLNHHADGRSNTDGDRDRQVAPGDRDSTR